MILHGCHINVKTKGNGPCIVLLHGWGQSHQSMDFIQEALCEHYFVINLDLAGFGKSEEPPTPWTIETYCDVLKELIDIYQCEKVMIIAHSFGARIALHYAYKYSCQGLILTGAAGIKPPRTFSYYWKVYWYKILKHLKIGNQLGSKDYQNASKTMKAVLVQAVNEDLTSLLPHIKVPTLLIWGKEDQETPLWMGEKMAEEMPYAHLITL